MPTDHTQQQEHQATHHLIVRPPRYNVPMARDLHDKVILITGASSGIGAATAIACADRGMHVSLAARSEDKLKEIARQVAAKGVRAHFFTCDVDDDTQVRKLFADSWERFGRLDAAFANAGYGLHKSVLDTTDAEHRALFETNYFGTVRTIHAAIPRLQRTADGLKHLLICSSAASEIALPMYGAYAATKAAQDALGGALRAEVADRGISVTTVHPVGTRTQFFDNASDRSGQRYQAGTPGGLMQSADDVADAIVASLLRPRPEVWPMQSARFGLALTTALPRVAAWAMRRHARKRNRLD